MIAFTIGLAVLSCLLCIVPANYSTLVLLCMYSIMYFIPCYLSLGRMTSGHSSSAINGKSMYGLLL